MLVLACARIKDIVVEPIHPYCSMLFRRGASSHRGSGLSLWQCGKGGAPDAYVAKRLREASVWTMSELWSLWAIDGSYVDILLISQRMSAYS